MEERNIILNNEKWIRSQLLKPPPDEDGDPTWWVDPPRSYLGGGFLDGTVYGGDIGIFDSGQYLKTGLSWVSRLGGAAIDIDDYYSYCKFSLANIGTVTEATLFFCFFDGYYSDNAEEYSIAIYHRITQLSTDFPKAALDTDDWADASKNIVIDATWLDMKTLINEVNVSSSWKSIDVTTEVQFAMALGWPWFAVRLQPNPPTPSRWQYYGCPLSAKQKIYVSAYGPAATEEGLTPVGFPVGWDALVPWLKVVFTGGTDQSSPGEGPEGGSVTITSIAADSKNRKIAFAGTDTSNLWKTIDGGTTWSKVQEGTAVSITAIAIDKINNFGDYPDDAIIWFGDSGGWVWKSIDSGYSFVRVVNLDNSIIDIAINDFSSSKVIIGAGNELYKTEDGGKNWSTIFTGASDITGFWVNGDEIQLCLE